MKKKKKIVPLYSSIFLIVCFVFFTKLSFAQVFWSEDFTDGIPADWGNVDLQGNNGEWTWCNDPTAGSGGGCPGITVGQMAFGATSADSGFVTVASDEIGSPGSSHTSELTTSVIDCSEYSEVYLSFETTIGIYELPADQNVFLQVSTDNVSWEDYFIFPDLDGTMVWSGNPEVITMNLTDQIGGAATVYLRWRWQAGWEYYWNLDDIKLWENNPLPPHDMQVNENWFAAHLNAKTPASQVEVFGFMADIENVGSTDQTGVALNMKIANNTGPTVFLYDETIEYGTVGVGELIENDLFPDPGFLPASEPGVYTGTYTVTADSMDSNSLNNEITFGFGVSEDVFEKDSGISNATGGAPPLEVWGQNEPYSWAYGNYYYMPNGEGMYATHVSFALANANEPGIPGEQLNARLYKWTDDMNNAEYMDPEEREWIGSAIYVIGGDEGMTDLIKLPLLDPISGDPNIALEDETAYVLMLEYSATGSKIIAFMITQDHDYAPAIYRSQELGEPRYAALLGYGEPLSSEAYSTFGFGRDVVPVVRMHISDDPVSIQTDNLLSADNMVEVYPNPAEELIHVSIDLTEQHDKGTIEIIDLNGKIVQRHNLENIHKAQLKFEIEGLSLGNYFLNLSTSKGQKIVPFTKVNAE